MTRTERDLDQFMTAVDLLLNEETWLAWAGQPGREPVSRDTRRALADYLSVVGGDGLPHGTRENMLDQLNASHGTGWAAPARSSEPGDSDTVWHAIDASGDEEPTSHCGSGDIRWWDAERITELADRRWCTHRACQKRIGQ
jgi:hypothetical protein